MPPQWPLLANAAVIITSNQRTVTVEIVNLEMNHVVSLFKLSWSVN